MPAKTLVYWDSCVFIDWMKENKPDRVALIRPVVEMALAGDLMIVTSAVTLAEVVRTVDGALHSPEVEKKIIDFFKNDYIEVRSFDRALAERSRLLQRESAFKGLAMPRIDSMHLATALSYKVPSVHSFDAKHLYPHHEKWGDPKMRVEAPCLPNGQMTLDMSA